MAKELKNAIIVEKSIKEKKDGEEYFAFEIKEKEDDKYAKSFKWFVKEGQKDKAKSFKKGTIVDISYFESKGDYNGKEVTYRNIADMEEAGKITEENVYETETYYETDPDSKMKVYTNKSFEPEDKGKGFSFGMAINGAILLTSQAHNISTKEDEMKAVEERFDLLYPLIEKKRKEKLL